VPEKYREPLDYADLDEHESKTDEQKIDRASTDQPARHPPNRRQRRQRDSEHYQHERQRNDYEQHDRRSEVAFDDARICLHRAQHRCRIGDAELIEEEWAVIRRRRNVDVEFS
jgi:FtsZ-interacting cell division protein YlmF